MSKAAEFVRQYVRMSRVGVSHRNAWRWAKNWAYTPMPF